MNKDGEFGINGHNVKSVIIELNDNKVNDSLIKRMIKQNNSQVKYSGGYKAKEPSRPQSAVKKPLYRPEEEPLSKLNAYEKLGLSKAQPKYQTPHTTEIINSQVYAEGDLEHKIELLRQDRQARTNLLFKPQDNLLLANEASRFQNVTHAQSSLDVINLENIEAKLKVHRANIREVEDEYNKKKGKVTPIDRYGYIKVNVDVEKEYRELQVDQDKIYELVQKREELGDEEVEFEELWEMKKRNDPKLAEYDAKYQEYLVSKDAKNLLGAVVRKNLYSWEKYKQPGATLSKEKTIAPSSNNNERSMEKKRRSPLKQEEKYGPDGLESVKDLPDILATKDDKFIASYIFVQIDTGKVGLISKEELHEYILSQKHIINGYNIDIKWLFTDLDNFETKRKGMFSKSELAIFLATLEKLDHPKLTLANSSNIERVKVEESQQKNPVTSTFSKHKHIFERIFTTLDFNEDKILKRAEFIENILIDSNCLKILDEEALKIKVINKGITYRQIIGFILDDHEKERNEKLKKSKEYITFGRFCEYFDCPESFDLSKIDQSSKKKEKGSKEIEVFDIPEEYLLLLKDIFNCIPRIYQDYIVSTDFVQTAMRDPQILALSDELCRIESVETGLPIESLQTTLHRMQKECDEYSTWETMKNFFSRRGRPIDWNFALITQKKEVRQKKFEEERKSLGKNKIKDVEEYFEYHENLKNRNKEKIVKAADKYTVPKPFDITDMKEKQNKDQVKAGEKEYEELKKKFKANPVNKEILEPKPELISGKVVKKSEKEIRPEFKYENYENDRIERALKKAQEQYEIEEKIKAIKEQTQVKALNVGIDLTTKYKDVINENEKKKKENNEFKKTIPKAPANLYPANPMGEQDRKLEKIKENAKKSDDVSKRKNEKLLEDKKAAREKNEHARKLAEEAKKRESEEEKKIKEMETEGLFKPNKNKQELKVSEDDERKREEAKKRKEERLEREKKVEEERLNMIKKHKEKILAHEKKENWKDIEGLDEDEILDHLYEINFENILNKDDIFIYRKLVDKTNLTKKAIKERELGLANRERAAMEAEERRIMGDKVKLKEQVQKEKSSNPIPPKEKEDSSSEEETTEAGKKVKKGEKKLAEDLMFHRSKALNRYREMIKKEDEKEEAERKAELQEQKTSGVNSKKVRQFESK